MSIKAVIIEDEIKSLNNLQNILRKNTPNVDIVGFASSIEQAEDLFDDPNLKIDVAFMDINLQDGLIFSLLEQLRPINFDIIFVTAFNEHAITACNFSSIGYIMKPIDPSLLVDAVNRVKVSTSNSIDQRLDVFRQNYENHPNSFQKMSIAGVDGIYFVNIKDIVRFEAADNYTHIFTKEGDKITVSKTIKSYEDMLTNLNFYRVHKRHIVNLNFMQKFVKGDGGYILMDDGEKIDVSRRRRVPFTEYLKQKEHGHKV